MNETRGHNHFQRVLELATPLQGVQLGLERMRRALERLGQPQRSFPALLIAGTNGKGSTANFLASLLQASGYRVGLYTSPHLEHYEERFQVDGHPAQPEEIAAALEEVIAGLGLAAGGPKRELPLTYFELTTLLAFLHFQRRRVEIAVLEVGVGGRLDATNVVEPLLSILCTVALDHQEMLGPDRPSIAREKLGIVRPGRPLICGVTGAEIARLVDEECRRRGALLRQLGRDFFVAAQADGSFDYRGQRQLNALRSPLPGRHQARNAALALQAAECLAEQGWQIRFASLAAAWEAIRWPGRIEIRPGSPTLLIDGCHNEEGALALAGYLRENLGRRRAHLLFALSATKDAAAILRPLLPLMSSATASQYSWEKSLPAPESARAAAALGAAVHCQPDPRQALAEALRQTAPQDWLVICGSLYFVGEIRPLLQEMHRP